MKQNFNFLEYLEERFGIPRKTFSGCSFQERNEKIYVFSKSVSDKNLEGLRIEGKGMLFGRYFKTQDKFKPTTNALQVFGREATKSIIKLTEKEKIAFINGEDLEKEVELESGYVILKYGKDIIGCGLYSNGSIKNQIPKARRKSLELI